jgi:putative aldouronate transport system substrate-binding protein
MTASTGIEWTQVDLTVPQMSNREADGAMLAIGANSANPERAFLFLDKLYTDPAVKIMADYGIEGTHYTLDNGYATAIADSGYNPGSQWKFGNQYNTLKIPGQPEDIWDQYIAYNASSIPTNSLGFAWNSDPVSSEIAAVKNVKDAYIKLLVSGSVDPTVVVPQFNAEMETAGLGTIIAEMQSQLDTWAASK